MTPLSRDPEARARQLDNLRPRPPAPERGNQRRRVHGGYSRVAGPRLEAKVRELAAALAEDAPLRDGEGEVPAHDHVQLSLLARALCRLEDVEANVRDFGMFDQRTGQLRPAVDVEARLRREVAGYLDAMGMSPRSRAALGLDLQRGFDLARALAELPGDGGEGGGG